MTKQELEQIKEQIAELQKKVEEYVVRCEVEHKYPIYCKSKPDGKVVRFTGLQEGTVLVNGAIEVLKVGETVDCFNPHTNKHNWEVLPTYKGIWHGALVWCWDDEDTHFRELRFMDAVNGCAFSCNGNPTGMNSDNYEIYKGEWPEWAKEAYKTLI